MTTEPMLPFFSGRFSLSFSLPFLLCSLIYQFSSFLKNYGCQSLSENEIPLKEEFLWLLEDSSLLPVSELQEEEFHE